MRLVKGYKGLREFGIDFSPQHLLRLMKAGKFPACRKLGNVCWWVREEVEAWIVSLPRPNTLPQRE
jgi:predicted DNA-binding transcriptional regulator AlpA